MFERYTEKARRVIFFARYEASQYGSRYIETEHILLGLVREDKTLMRWALGRLVSAEEVRKEIESTITKRERISTSVEVPLSADSKQILLRASEQAAAMDHRYIEPKHLLLAATMAEGSRAARILAELGLKASTLRERMAKGEDPVAFEVKVPYDPKAIEVLHVFLASLTSNIWVECAKRFAANAQFIDWAGKRWIGRDEIEKQFAEMVARYAKRDVTFRVEYVDESPANCRVASILWENVAVAGADARAKHRMTAVLAREDNQWTIFLLQITPIAIP